MLKKKLEQWTLYGTWPYVPDRDRSIETGALLSGVIDPIPASVPGCVYRDLQNAGLIDDPYYERNSLLCEWVASRWWIYRTSFRADPAWKGRRIRLVFKGVDYKGRVYINNQKVADHEGMYVPCIVDVTDLLRYEEENLVQVVLEHAPDEMGQIGYTSQTHTQKARFGYKWDFGTRLVHLGLYDDVYIDVTGPACFESTHVRFDGETLHCSAQISGPAAMRAVLSYNGRTVADASAASIGRAVSLDLPVPDPALWYPNGYGPQPLYDLELQLTADGGLSDCRRLRVGLRTLAYTPCDDAPAGSLPYIPVINGKKIYIKGVNMTPLDHMYGCVGAEQYRPLLELARDANVNLVRVWGGGLIEKEAFYELCDELGLMVWQEFIQSSSGLDNVPSKRPEFLRLAAATARAAVKEKRNHVSLTFWGGGNELYDPQRVPETFEDENLAMLRGITNTLDPDRLMLPTSASGPCAFIDNDRPAENHDVHGPWKYYGPEGQYTLYNNAAIQLHSEFGNDGMSCLSSLEKFLAPENLVVTTMKDNLTWRHHGEWWDTYGYRDQPLFGDMDDLSTFVKVSQYMQAEGIRYAIETHRRRAFRNGGSIVWQLNEPWPNVSCTSMVDYYNTPKLAYYFYRDAMRSYHVSLRYEKLVYRAGDTFRGRTHVHDDGGQDPDRVSVRVLGEQGETVWERAESKAFAFEWAVPEGLRSFSVVCEAETKGRKVSQEYLFFAVSDSAPYADTGAVLRFYERYPF